MHGLALFEGVELHGTCADNLENDGNGAGFAVKPGDGQGDALGVLLCADNDKLAGLCLLGNERRMDAKFGYGGVQFSPFYNGKHNTPYS